MSPKRTFSGSKTRLAHSRTLLTWVLIAAMVWSLISLGLLADFNSNSLQILSDILKAAFQPELSPAYLYRVFLDALTTFAYAVTSMSLALLIGGGIAVLGSGTLFGKTPAFVARAVSAVLRSIHELVWALLLIQALGLSPWAGILAIAVPYGGILGRIFSDQIKDVPEQPLLALRASGASKLSILAYGRIPIAAKGMLSYLTYRFECALRSAAVLSFIGLGGLGFRIEIALADLNYAKAWTPIWMLIFLVAGFDLLFSRFLNMSQSSKNYQPADR